MRARFMTTAELSISAFGAVSPFFATKTAKTTKTI